MKPHTSWKEIKKTLKEIEDNINGIDSYDYSDTTKSIIETIKSLIQSVCESVIGKPEPEEIYGSSDLPPVDDEEAIIRNSLRTEQLEKLKKIMK